MVSELTLWDEDLASNDEETYQDLVRSIRRTNGFRLLFVRCNRGQNHQLIKNITTDLPQRKIQTLKIEEPIDNLYDRIAKLPDLAQIDTLFIEGLEFSIFEYEDREFKDINQRSKAAVYGGSTKGVPLLFAHLNMQRERFRDDFPVCMIFLVPDFALNYFIRRAPDFFDWRSQTFKFAPDSQNIAVITFRILIEGDYQKYLRWTPQARVEQIVEIKDILNVEKNLLLYRELGNILCADQRWESAIESYDHALAIAPNWQASYNRGNALGNIGRIEEAIESYDRSLAIEPDNTDSWNNRGIALVQLGRTAEAIESYDRALAINPDKHRAWYNKACCYASQNQVDLALQFLQQAIHLNPDEYIAMAQTDSDFDSIRNNPKFMAFMKEIENTF